MQIDRIVLRRWMNFWVLITTWMGVLPLLFVASYYRIADSEQFSPALVSLRKEKLVFAIRVGGAAYRRLSIGYYSAAVGANAGNPVFDEGKIEVSNGSLASTYQGTYLTWFRGSRFPVVLTLAQKVSTDGAIAYSVHMNGTGPIMRYISYCLLAGAGATVFLGTIGIRGKKTRVIGTTV